MRQSRKQDPDQLRRKLYPDLVEQLGAAMKALDALSKGKPIPADAQAVIEETALVKRRVPKKKNPA